MRVLATLLYTLFIFLTPLAHAANSVMIWPIDPVINPDDKATELWLENRGNATTMMQVRIFGWQQVAEHEQYQTQQGVVASPPVVRIDPGQKQLIRLIRLNPTPAGQELAYRVVLDEIPTPKAPAPNQAGLNFQMRYSVPLFTYGSGVTADSAKPQLSWQQVSSGGRHWLQLNNQGNGHARLSNLTIGGRALGQGLFGYVLAHSSNRWPLNSTVSGELQAEMNKSHWRSLSSQ
ncbi:fimbrial biogenesis chaperone [Candidatus Pantoea multigeneris]|uniref:Molecular chaperone n=1 Tax=Candidatus Pantoea multigeneris TaxID=2608357 RepID=A0ABX0RDI5_9GAMM|nr:molecular chaperone [Pantoea multigeneris]NIF21295.1 molecular chaperone [Pantoea multigeneris]